MNLLNKPDINGLKALLPWRTTASILQQKWLQVIMHPS